MDVRICWTLGNSVYLFESNKLQQSCNSSGWSASVSIMLFVEYIVFWQMEKFEKWNSKEAEFAEWCQKSRVHGEKWNEWSQERMLLWSWRTGHWVHYLAVQMCSEFCRWIPALAQSKLSMGPQSTDETKRVRICWTFSVSSTALDFHIFEKR